MRIVDAFLTIIVLTSAAGAGAQEGESVLRLPHGTSHTGFASKGVRLTVAKPILVSEITVHSKRSMMTPESSSPAASIAIGYAYLPVRRIGWTAELGGSTADSNLNNQPNLRAAGNIAAAVNSSFYAKSGLNVSQIVGDVTIKNVATSFEPRLGFQTGIGYQLSPLFGLEANYLWLHQAGSQNTEFYQQGAELGLSGTF